MNQRTILIIAGVVALLSCAVLGVGGFFVFSQFQRQQAQLAQLQATLAAGVPSPAAPPATTRPTSAARPTPTSAGSEDTAPTAAPESATESDATAEATVPPAASVAPGAIPDPAVIAQPDLAASLSADSRAALAQHPDATLYRIGARLDPVSRTIAGQQTVRLTNTEDRPLSEVYFRLYVNAPHYNEGGITVDDVRVGGQPAQTTLEVGDTALRVALLQPLAQGQVAEISMRFTTTVPTSGGGYGIFNEADGVFALYNWHPEVAVYENGAWLLNPVTQQGDPTNTDASNYVVAFAAPAGYKVVSGGVETGRADAGGQQVHQIVSALTRNFVVVASDRLLVASQQAGGAKVNAYYLAADEEGGRKTLATAARSLELFGKQFGAYPYAELDVAEIRLGGGAAGMEATGLILIGSDYYKGDDPLAGLGGMVKGAEELSVLDFTTAHEVAHQWWYGTVGSDAYKQPWLDESLTNWSAAFYVDDKSGADAGLLARDIFIGLPYRQTLAQRDVRLDQPVDKFNELEYSAIVYGKGALMYDVLRKQIGDQKFFEFLRRYYAGHQFGRVDGAGWRATLAEVAGQSVADAFYQKWVEGSAIKETDLPPGGAMSNLLGNLGGMDQILGTPTPGR